MKRISRSHRLDPGMRNWIIAYSERNLWRVLEWYALEDLVQEGFFCYCKCALMYPMTKVAEPKHFMSLVQATFKNRIHNLAKKKRVREVEETTDPEDKVFDEPIPENSMFLTMLNQLPKELKDLISLLLAGNVPSMERYEDGARETTNEYLCRLAKLDPKHIDVREILREHFQFH